METGSNATDLPRLRDPADGYMDDVVVARETHLADLVGLYTSEGTTGGCGRAYRPTTLNPSNQANGFSVAHLDYVGASTCSQYTLAHEFGHNMGNHHDTDNDSLPILYPYSHGYDSPTSVHRTIMAYDCPASCPRINHWSNPAVSIGPEPTGVVGVSNNAQSMDNSRQMVAQYRTSCFQAPLVVNEIDYDQSGVDSAEFIELMNVYTDTVNLDGYYVELINGSTSSVYDTINLPNMTLAPNDYFVICGDGGNVPNCDLVLPTTSDIIQNGAPDAVALRNGSDQLVDTVSYEGDTSSPYTEGTGAAGDDSTAYLGLSRFVDGADSNQNSVDVVGACITPGLPNSDAAPPCAADLAIGKRAATSDAVAVGDVLTYTLTVTNSGAIIANAVLTDVFPSTLSNIACTAAMTERTVDRSAEITLGTFMPTAADCTDALGNTPANTFDNTGDAGTSTSPISCAVAVDVEGVVTSSEFSASWDPIYPPTPASFDWDVGWVRMRSASNVYQQVTDTGATGSTAAYTYDGPITPNFAGQQAQGTWLIELHDIDTDNQGHEVDFGASLTELVLYGYPYEVNTVALSAGTIQSGTAHVINPNQVLTYSCTAEVNATACDVGMVTITNSADVRAIEDPDGVVSSNTTVNVINQTACPAPELSIDKTYAGPTPVVPGDIVTYTITVSNAGDVAATTNITDTFPAQFGSVSCDGGTVVANQLTDTVSVDANSAETYTCTATALPAITCAATTITNTVSASATNFDPSSHTLLDLGDPFTAQATCFAAVASFTVDKTLNSTPDNGEFYQIGEAITWTVRVNNTGDVPLDTLSLRDEPQACMTCDYATDTAIDTVPIGGFIDVLVSCTAVANAVGGCSNTAIVTNNPTTYSLENMACNLMAVDTLSTTDPLPIQLSEVALTSSLAGLLLTVFAVGLLLVTLLLVRRRQSTIVH